MRCFFHCIIDGRLLQGEMESEFIKLLHNIDPQDPEDSYLLKKIETGRDEAFDPPDKKYRIHEEDREKISKIKKESGAHTCLVNTVRSKWRHIPSEAEGQDYRSLVRYSIMI